MVILIFGFIIIFTLVCIFSTSSTTYPVNPPFPVIPPIPPVVYPPIIEYNNFWIFTFTNRNSPTTTFVQVRGVGGGLAVEHSFPIDFEAQFDPRQWLTTGLNYTMYARFTDSTTAEYPFVAPNSK